MKKLLLIMLSVVAINAYAAKQVVEYTSAKLITSKAAVKSMPGMPVMVTVNGKIKNIDSALHEAVVTIAFLDKNGEILGTATGFINDLAAGQTKPYKAMGQNIPSRYDKVEVQINMVH